MLLHQCVFATVFQKISKATTSKEIWDILQETYGNAGKIEAVKLQSLQRQYELLCMIDQASVADYLGRLQVLVNSMRACDEPVKNNKVVAKILRILTTKPSLAAMQQQNANMVNQQNLALQQMESARLAAEVTQQRHLEALHQIGENRSVAGSSQASLPRVQEWSLEDFLQHHPSRFDGKVSPDGADQWMRDMERIYDAKRCPVENRLAYTKYLLAGEAVHWWSSMKMMLEDSQETITWELFKKKFYAEYFPDSVRYAKEVEFLQLMQGDMSVSEYAEKFKPLGRFHTLKMAEDWQCRKFENGLRGDLKLMVAPLSIQEFPALVEKARVMEKLKAEVEAQQRSQQKVGRPSGSTSKHNDRRKSYSRPQSQGPRRFSHQPQQSQPSRPQCFHYRGPHLRSACPSYLAGGHAIDVAKRATSSRNVQLIGAQCRGLHHSLNHIRRGEVRDRMRLVGCML